MSNALRSGALFVLVACGSSAPAPAPVAAPDPGPPVDAAPTDPGPDPATVERERAKEAAMATTAYVFRYQSAARSETWTLWVASGVAVLNVQPDGGAVMQYQGTAGDGDPMALAVQSATAKMTLTCKRTTRQVELPCDPAAPAPKKTTNKSANKTANKTIEALDCFHADFKEPMPFGVMPGIVYVADGACAGYRSISP